MINPSLDDALFERQLARFDQTVAPASSAHKAALLGAVRAAGWRALGHLRQEGPRRLQTDVALARAFRDGDADALELLYERYHGKLVAYARAAGCPNEAEDFAQVAFVALMSTAPTDNPDLNVPGYLFKVVRNHTIKHSLRRAREIGLDDEDRLPDDARSSLELLITEQGIARAAAIIDTHCTVVEQAVLTLANSDLSTAEIAERLELTSGNVRVIRHRALAKLRVAFDEDPS